jgi:hypothetical protein
VHKIIGIPREAYACRGDGATIAIRLAVGEATHRGEPIYVGILRELTQRNRIEAQLCQSQKMESWRASFGRPSIAAWPEKAFDPFRFGGNEGPPFTWFFRGRAVRPLQHWMQLPG